MIMAGNAETGAMKGIRMRKMIVLLVVLLAPARAFSDPRGTYLELLDQGKFAELERHLAAWTRAEGRNPEVYIGWFNYYINRNRKTGLEIDTSIDPRSSHMIVTDPSSGKVIGYLGDKVYYDYADVQSAVRYLDIGIGCSANRLDMHFGKIRILGETGQFEKQAEAVTRVLELSAGNGNLWLWIMDEPLADGKRFLLENLQDYYDLWFRLGTPESLAAIDKAASRQVEIYPEHAFAYNALAYCHNARGKPDVAMRFLLEAHARQRNDYVITGNIAALYMEMGDVENARRFFTLTLASSDPEIAKWAAGMLASLP